VAPTEQPAGWRRDLEPVREIDETHFGASAGARYRNIDPRIESYFLSFDGGVRLESMTLLDRLPALHSRLAAKRGWMP